MNNQSMRVLTALALLAGAAATRGALVLDDPLQASTTGARSGGVLLASGWQVTGKDDTYRFREEWGPDGAGNSVLKLYRDGKLLLTTSAPGAWQPVGHSVRIGASPRRDPAAGAPVGAVFSNVRVWDLTSQTNLVRLRGRAFCDDRGPFLGLGVSYFQALRHARLDRNRLKRNLALFAAKGFNYVRVLSMVSWDGLEIAPVTFTNRAGRVIAAWPDYWPQFRDLLDLAAEQGLRTEVTIFADAQTVMPSKTARQIHLDGILANIAGRESKLQHLEVANEAWQNGFPGAQGIADLRAAAQYLADRTRVLVAITSNDDTSDEGITALYRGSAADLATVHFSRDTRTPEGGWLPVRDVYRAGELPGVPPVTSNEPIGPGSSVASESDPVKLSAAAAFAFLAKLPGYVYHSRAGVYGYARCCPPSGGEEPFELTAGIDAYRHLRRILPPDMANWTRNDGLEPSAPFTVFCDGQPNRYWTESRGATNGCHRNIGGATSNEFVCLPMGILPGGVTLEARRPVRFEVFHPLTGEALSNLTLQAGERCALPQGPGAYILRGTGASSPAAGTAAEPAFKAAQAAEERGDFASALLGYETFYDSTATDEATRAALRARFAALRPKVAPNADPQKAGVWKVKAFAFRELDFAWKDKRGTNHHARHRYRADEIDRLRRGMRGFAERVWNYSDGQLRIDWDLTVLEKPLTRLDGEYSFWPGPDACMPHLDELKSGEMDTIMVFAKAWSDPKKDAESEGVPEMLLGGALGALGEFTRHATYIGFNWGSGAVENEPDGEPMLHEWLHSAQWTLEDYQGYPRGLMHTSDGGKMEGDTGGDPCYRRKKSEPSWMGFYRHLMRDHVTRRMWRELSLRQPPGNVWANTYCHSFLVLGPYAAADKPVMGLDFPFIDESLRAVTPGAKVGDRTWRTARTEAHTLDLAQFLTSRPNQVAYVAARVRSPSSQPAQLRVGSDDGCKVWHNGRQVVFASATRGAEPDQDVVDVTLAPGENLFLMKVANGHGGWAAILRLTDRQGGPLPGLSYLAP